MTIIVLLGKLTKLSRFSLSAAVGRDTELTRGCVIGAFCEVTGHEALADNTIIYGDQYDQRRQYEKPPVSAFS